MLQFNYPKITILSLLIMTSTHVKGDNSLNLSFLQGDAKSNIPEVLSLNKKYPAGEYVLEIIFNNESHGYQNITVLPEDGDVLCLSPDWLNNSKIPLNLSLFDEYYDSSRQCYLVEKYPSAQVYLDYGSQVLRFRIPQAALKNENSSSNWDYGIPGVRLAWSGNMSKSEGNEKQIYGNFDFNANFSRWVLSAKTSAFNGQGFNTPEATLSTVIAPIRGKILIGKTITASTLLSDFGFYGISLISDSNMAPNTRGYAPLITGVAATNARVTVSQGSYVIASEIVPPGAFSFDNIRPVSNGELTVTIEEEDGSKTVRMYPVTVLPTLLRTGDFNYNIVMGTRSDDVENNKDINSIFAMGSLDYGFKALTLNSATVLHSNYQSIGSGISKDLGALGALSVSINSSRSVFDNNYLLYKPLHTQYGFSGQIKYAKGLADNTNLQLLTYRYTGENYVDFSQFNSNSLYSLNSRKERYEATLTHRFDNSFINMFAWTQSYRDSGGRDSGVNLNISTTINKASITVGADYGNYSHTDDDNFSISINLSVPFSLFDRPHYNTNSVSYSRAGKFAFNTGVSGSFNDDVSYNISSGHSNNQTNASANIGASFDKLNAGMSISQNNSTTGVSLRASGSLIVTEPTGILLSREQNNTIAIARLKDIPGVKFNGGAPTNNDGVTAFYISPYTKNDIKINTEQLPDNIELTNSVYSVTPTERAIVYRDFPHNEIKRYILRVKGLNGKSVMSGSKAYTEQGINAGFVSHQGVLLVNVLSAPKEITINQQNGEKCKFNMEGFIENENKVKEVICE